MEPLSIEKSFDVAYVKKWSDDIKHVSVYAAVIYVIFVLGGRIYLREKSGYQLRGLLFVWNFALALFSIIGMVRTVPDLVGALEQQGWLYSICDSSFYRGQTTALWAYAFVFSKIIELGDTAFIVLRKQQLTFLHFYHHTTVLLYCFYSYPEHVAAGRWYTVMNFSVHSIMYSYYALRALRFRVPKFISMSITSLQIVQMVIGFVVTVSVVLVKSTGRECDHSFKNAVIASLMYLSYLLLFVHFFYRAYAAPSSAKKMQSNGDVAVNGVGKKEI